MSGQQIGTVIGGAIGAYFGGPAGAQLGMAIGGMIGGALDPTRINGPHIGDGQQQNATDGAPIAWVLGTSPFIAGTIIEVGSRYEVKVKDSGKGGPVVSHYEAHQSFAILVCESSEIKGSTVSSILMVEQDGKIVYDVRPGSTIIESSYHWAQSVDFLYGGEDQMPHPTLEAIHGVGSTNPYRGRCIAVFKNFNLSKAGNRIPSFRFVVASTPSNEGISIAATDDWKYREDPDGGANYASPDYDDSGWAIGPGGFGTSYNTLPANTQLPSGAPRTIWIRKTIAVRNTNDIHINTAGDDTVNVYWDGELIDSHGFGSASVVIPGVIGLHTIACSAEDTTGPGQNIYLAAGVTQDPYTTGPGGPNTLDIIVSRICERGGLSAEETDVTDIADIDVTGYPIARQASAADCLSPILAAFFTYASEYDGKLYFRKYGADANITIDRDDIVESESGDDNASILSTKRGQATEYPRKITVSYYDPNQNYMVVNITNERISSDVQAIGEQTLPIPVVMNADDAAKAAAKAMKVAYATLEGTREYSVPFVGHAGISYLSIAPGDAVLLDGKRWSVGEVTLQSGAIHLKTTYSRQSAYTSNVQAIPGNSPTPPDSTLPGGTAVLPFNLPSLRPQDTYGLYVAVSGYLDSWPGATVQISYDQGHSWSNAFDTSYPSIMGTLTANESSGVLSVKVNDTLESVTTAQLSVGANAAAVVGANNLAELIQFKTATETSLDNYDLSDVTRGLKGTPTAPRAVGDQFAMLDAVHFIPIDPSYSGLTIMLRGVSYGTAVENATVVSIVYTAVTPPAASVARRLEDGTPRITASGIARILE